MEKHENVHDNNLHDNTIERERMINIHRSNGSKIGWKRHHASHMRGIRQRERDNMNKSFYAVSKELGEAINTLSEASVNKDDIFNYNGELLFDQLAGGISFSLDKTENEVSISTIMNENGSANYKLETPITDEASLKQLYNDLKSELKGVADLVDNEVKQILARHGLRPTS